MSDGMLLGIDEGTTGVKAALFDQRLQPVAEARRDKMNRHPEEGWVEQDGEEVIAAVTASVAKLLNGADGDVVACGLDHQGESVLAWDSGTGKPLSPIVVWQDKRSQEILDELTGEEDEVRELSGLAFDPYFSAAKLAWLLKNNDDVKKARDDGRLRMGTVDSFLCDQLGAGFATEPATASRTQLQRIDKPGWDERLCEIFGIPMDVLPEIRDPAGDLGTLKHESWPVELPLRGQTVDQQAALAGAACVEPGRVKATYGTGVFVLAHVGKGVPKPAGGLLPTIAWSIDGKLEYALDGGVFAAGAMLEWMCNELGIAKNPPELSKLARKAESSLALACSRPRRDRRAVVAAQRARRDLRDLRRHNPRERRPGGAGGDRLAGGRRGRRDQGDLAGRNPASRRRPNQRAAAPAASGRRDRRTRRSGWGGCDRNRCGRARRSRGGSDLLAGRAAGAAAA